MAAPLLSCQGVTVYAGTDVLFRDLELSLQEGDRVGLVGQNGCGKTTLLGLLSGAITPHAGQVAQRRGLRLRAVPQHLPQELERCTVTAVACSGVATGRDDGDDVLFAAQRMLDRVGLDPACWDAPALTLSGGAQTRLLLARALLGEPDLLLLDEPTNHMDLGGLLSLERFLRDEVSAAYLVVSHDREFLDRCTAHTLFLRDQGLRAFALPFSAARQALFAQDEAALAARKAEERQIDRLRRSAQRLSIWGRTFNSPGLSRRAQSIERRVERLQESRTSVTAVDRRALALGAQEVGVRSALRVEDLAVQTPLGRPLFRVERLYVQREDRVALLGDNGCGKSTLLGLLADASEAPRPECRFHPQLRVGSFTQALADLRGPTPLCAALAAATGLPDEALTRELSRAGFPRPRHDQPLETLSGGERARLRLLMLKLARPGVFLLDEPTNHLDIDGREQLEDELIEASAVVIFTSHDRRFVRTVATRFLWVRDGALVELPDPDEYYAHAAAPKPAPRAPRPAAARERPRPRRRPPAELSEDELLARSLEIEDRLATATLTPKERGELSRELRDLLAAMERFGAR